eukprot:1220118-Rhodomonas_salina.1
MGMGKKGERKRMREAGECGRGSAARAGEREERELSRGGSVREEGGGSGREKGRDVWREQRDIERETGREKG